MGWGAILGHLTVGDVWDCYRHIDDRVTEAIWLALQHFAPVLKGRHVPAWTDSMTAKAVINRQGDLRSTFEMRFARRIGRWSSQNVLSFTAGHIPGNNDVATDTLSGGGPYDDEWNLVPIIVGMIGERFRRAQTDLFRTTVHPQVPLVVLKFRQS